MLFFEDKLGWGKKKSEGGVLKKKQLDRKSEMEKSQTSKRKKKKAGRGEDMGGERRM